MQRLAELTQTRSNANGEIYEIVSRGEARQAYIEFVRENRPEILDAETDADLTLEMMEVETVTEHGTDMATLRRGNIELHKNRVSSREEWRVYFEPTDFQRVTAIPETPWERE